MPIGFIGNRPGRLLVAAGSSLERVASVQFLLTNPEDFAGFNEEWSRWFPQDPPARSGARHPLAVQPQPRHPGFPCRFTLLPVEHL